jgi:hypothetical protein
MEYPSSHEHRVENPIAGIPMGALQQFDDRRRADAVHKEEAGDKIDEHKKHILCKTCGNFITSDADSITVNGSHDHTFVNPMGLKFHIGCFSNAGGCRIMGVPTDEYTWFPGFAWSYVICSGCQTHLGWHYQSGGGGFFGLILDQLVRH